MNFRMVSYADNFEDVLLQRAFEMESRGFYIDVGAYNPVDHSVTKHFYDKGWWGINVEPNPTPFAVLQAARDRDVNLNIGLSNRDGQLSIMEAPGACWSVDKNLLTGYFGASEADIITHSIEVKTLAEICDRHVPAGTTIDFLKVDVEGHEREVLEGGDWARYRPRIVMAEALGFEAWEGLLQHAGYHFALFEGVNRIYVRDEDAHLIPRLNYPVNTTDCFLIYGYLRRINEMQLTIEQLQHTNTHQADELQRMHDRYDEFGPASIQVAQQLNKVARRYPGASRLAKKVVHRMSQGA